MLDNTYNITRFYILNMENNGYSGIKHREYLRDSERPKSTANKSSWLPSCSFSSAPLELPIFSVTKSKTKKIYRWIPLLVKVKYLTKPPLSSKMKEKLLGF